MRREASRTWYAWWTLVWRWQEWLVSPGLGQDWG